MGDGGRGGFTGDGRGDAGRQQAGTMHPGVWQAQDGVNRHRNAMVPMQGPVPHNPTATQHTTGAQGRPVGNFAANSYDFAQARPQGPGPGQLATIEQIAGPSVPPLRMTQTQLATIRTDWEEARAVYASMGRQRKYVFPDEILDGLVGSESGPLAIANPHADLVMSFVHYRQSQHVESAHIRVYNKEEAHAMHYQTDRPISIDAVGVAVRNLPSRQFGALALTLKSLVARGGKGFVLASDLPYCVMQMIQDKETAQIPPSPASHADSGTPVALQWGADKAPSPPAVAAPRQKHAQPKVEQKVEQMTETMLMETREQMRIEARAEAAAETANLHKGFQDQMNEGLKKLQGMACFASQAGGSIRPDSPKKTSDWVDKLPKLAEQLDQLPQSTCPTPPEQEIIPAASIPGLQQYLQEAMKHGLHAMSVQGARKGRRHGREGAPGDPQSSHSSSDRSKHDRSKSPRQKDRSPVRGRKEGRSPVRGAGRSPPPRQRRSDSAASTRERPPPSSRGHRGSRSPRPSEIERHKASKSPPESERRKGSPGDEKDRKGSRSPGRGSGRKGSRSPDRGSGRKDSRSPGRGSGRKVSRSPHRSGRYKDSRSPDRSGGHSGSRRTSGTNPSRREGDRSRREGDDDGQPVEILPPGAPLPELVEPMWRSARKPGTFPAIHFGAQTTAAAFAAYKRKLMAQVPGLDPEQRPYRIWLLIPTHLEQAIDLLDVCLSSMNDIRRRMGHRVITEQMVTCLLQSLETACGLPRMEHVTALQTVRQTGSETMQTYYSRVATLARAVGEEMLSKDVIGYFYAGLLDPAARVGVHRYCTTAGPHTLQGAAATADAAIRGQSMLKPPVSLATEAAAAKENRQENRPQDTRTAKPEAAQRQQGDGGGRGDGFPRRDRGFRRGEGGDRRYPPKELDAPPKTAHAPPAMAAVLAVRAGEGGGAADTNARPEYPNMPLSRRAEARCHNCGDIGHMMRECTKPKAPRAVYMAKRNGSPVEQPASVRRTKMGSVTGGSASHTGSFKSASEGQPEGSLPSRASSPAGVKGYSKQLSAPSPPPVKAGVFHSKHVLSAAAVAWTAAKPLSAGGGGETIQAAAKSASTAATRVPASVPVLKCMLGRGIGDAVPMSRIQEDGLEADVDDESLGSSSSLRSVATSRSASPSSSSGRSFTPSSHGAWREASHTHQQAEARQAQVLDRADMCLLARKGAQLPAKRVVTPQRVKGPRTAREEVEYTKWGPKPAAYWPQTFGPSSQAAHDARLREMTSQVAVCYQSAGGVTLSIERKDGGVSTFEPRVVLLDTASEIDTIMSLSFAKATQCAFTRDNQASATVCSGLGGQSAFVGVVPAGQCTVHFNKGTAAEWNHTGTICITDSDDFDILVGARILNSKGGALHSMLKLFTYYCPGCSFQEQCAIPIQVTKVKQQCYMNRQRVYAIRRALSSCAADGEVPADDGVIGNSAQDSGAAGGNVACNSARDSGADDDGIACNSALDNGAVGGGMACISGDDNGATGDGLISNSAHGNSARGNDASGRAYCGTPNMGVPHSGQNEAQRSLDMSGPNGSGPDNGTLGWGARSEAGGTVETRAVHSGTQTAVEWAAEAVKGDVTPHAALAQPTHGAAGVAPEAGQGSAPEGDEGLSMATQGRMALGLPAGDYSPADEEGLQRQEREVFHVQVQEARARFAGDLGSTDWGEKPLETVCTLTPEEAEECEQRRADMAEEVARAAARESGIVMLPYQEDREGLEQAFVLFSRPPAEPEPYPEIGHVWRAAKATYHGGLDHTVFEGGTDGIVQEGERLWLPGAYKLYKEHHGQGTAVPASEDFCVRHNFPVFYNKTFIIWFVPFNSVLDTVMELWRASGWDEMPITRAEADRFEQACEIESQDRDAVYQQALEEEDDERNELWRAAMGEQQGFHPAEFVPHTDLVDSEAPWEVWDEADKQCRVLNIIQSARVPHRECRRQHATDEGYATCDECWERSVQEVYTRRPQRYQVGIRYKARKFSLAKVDTAVRFRAQRATEIQMLNTLPKGMVRKRHIGNLVQYYDAVSEAKRGLWTKKLVHRHPECQQPDCYLATVGHSVEEGALFPKGFSTVARCATCYRLHNVHRPHNHKGDFVGDSGNQGHFFESEYGVPWLGTTAVMADAQEHAVAESLGMGFEGYPEEQVEMAKRHLYRRTGLHAVPLDGLDTRYAVCEVQDGRYVPVAVIPPVQEVGDRPFNRVYKDEVIPGPEAVSRHTPPSRLPDIAWEYQQHWRSSILQRNGKVTQQCSKLPPRIELEQDGDIEQLYEPSAQKNIWRTETGVLCSIMDDEERDEMHKSKGGHPCTCGTSTPQLRRGAAVHDYGQPEDGMSIGSGSASFDSDEEFFCVGSLQFHPRLWHLPH